MDVKRWTESKSCLYPPQRMAYDSTYDGLLLRNRQEQTSCGSQERQYVDPGCNIGPHFEEIKRRSTTRHRKRALSKMGTHDLPEGRVL